MHGYIAILRLPMERIAIMNTFRNAFRKTKRIQYSNLNHTLRQRIIYSMGINKKINRHKQTQPTRHTKQKTPQVRKERLYPKRWKNMGFTL